MTDSAATPRAQGDAPIPAWLVLNVVTDAVVDQRWGQYDPSEGCSPEVWVEAKEGDFVGTRDELVDVLRVMEERGWIRLDWEADLLSP